MDLWKDLDKITAFFKKSPVKILMLDFDGTLTPIVRFPKDAFLSKEMRNLLKVLSKKKEFYLLIISGRKLSDIKDKIMLSNVIYGGNHGLEGEIFGKKYLFPLPSTAIWTLGKIQKQLNQITDKFKGTFIEDKGLTLSFHYRLANKQQVPEVKLLFKKTLKSYVRNELISIIAGKKVFDIQPKVNWNKGSFAKLVINQIHKQTKTMPVVIFIGDDKTDKEVFQVLENGVTIKVGKNHKSDAKYSLKNTKEVFTFLEWINKKL